MEVWAGKSLSVGYGTGGQDGEEKRSSGNLTAAEPTAFKPDYPSSWKLQLSKPEDGTYFT